METLPLFQWDKLTQPADQFENKWEEVVILTAHIRDAVIADEYSLTPQVREPASEIIKAELGESLSTARHEGQGGLQSQRRENESSLGQNHIRLIHFPLTQLVATVRSEDASRTCV